MQELDSIEQDIKTILRKNEQRNEIFERSKSKNCDRYYSQILNQKKQQYYEALQMVQDFGKEQARPQSRITANQFNKTGKHGQLIRAKSSEGGPSKRVNKVKFTGAGYPIHDYLREMREENQRRKPKAKKQEQILSSAVELENRLPDQEQTGSQVNIVENINRELKLEREDLMKRKAQGVLSSDEKMEQDLLDEMERERKHKIAVVKQLVHGDIKTVDNKQFNMYLTDDLLMDEFTKQVLETFYPNEQNSQIALELKDILKQMDKELFHRVRHRTLTIRQLKARCLEKVNGNRFKCIVWDDIKDRIPEDQHNIDKKQINQYMKAAFGKGISEMQITGPNGILADLEPWQADPRCLRSLKKVDAKAKSARNDRTLGWAAVTKKTVPLQPKVGIKNEVQKMTPEIVTKAKSNAKMEPIEVPDLLKMTNNELDVSKKLFGTLTDRQKRQRFKQQASKEPRSRTHRATGRPRNAIVSKSLDRKSGQTLLSDRAMQDHVNQQYGFLQRLIDDGQQVILNEKFANKINYGSQVNTTQSAYLATQQSAEELNDLTMNERQRMKLLNKRKPRPRDLFDVQGIIERRERRALERIQSHESPQKEQVVTMQFDGQRFQEVSLIHAEQAARVAQVSPIPETENEPNSPVDYNRIQNSSHTPQDKNESAMYVPMQPKLLVIEQQSPNNRTKRLIDASHIPLMKSASPETQMIKSIVQEEESVKRMSQTGSIMSPDDKQLSSNLDRLATQLKMKTGSPWNSFGREKKSQPLLLMGQNFQSEQPAAEEVPQTINIDDGQDLTAESKRLKFERMHTQQVSVAQSSSKEEGIAQVQVSMRDQNQNTVSSRRERPDQEPNQLLGEDILHIVDPALTFRTQDQIENTPQNLAEILQVVQNKNDSGVVKIQSNDQADIKEEKGQELVFDQRKGSQSMAASKNQSPSNIITVQRHTDGKHARRNARPDSAGQHDVRGRNKKDLTRSHKGSTYSGISGQTELVPIHLLSKYPTKISQKMRIKKRMYGEKNTAAAESSNKASKMLIRVKEYQTARSGMANSEKKARKVSPDQLNINSKEFKNLEFIASQESVQTGQHTMNQTHRQLIRNSKNMPNLTRESPHKLSNQFWRFLNHQGIPVYSNCLENGAYDDSRTAATGATNQMNLAFSQDEILFQNVALKDPQMTSSAYAQSQIDLYTDEGDTVIKRSREGERNSQMNHTSKLLNLARNADCARTYLQYQEKQMEMYLGQTLSTPTHQQMSLEEFEESLRRHGKLGTTAHESMPSRQQTQNESQDNHQYTIASLQSPNTQSSKRRLMSATQHPSQNGLLLDQIHQIRNNQAMQTQTPDFREDSEILHQPTYNSHYLQVRAPSTRNVGLSQYQTVRAPHEKRLPVKNDELKVTSHQFTHEQMQKQIIVQKKLDKTRELESLGDRIPENVRRSILKENASPDGPSQAMTAQPNSVQSTQRFNLTQKFPAKGNDSARLNYYGKQHETKARMKTLKMKRGSMSTKRMDQPGSQVGVSRLSNVQSDNQLHNNQLSSSDRQAGNLNRWTSRNPATFEESHSSSMLQIRGKVITQVEKQSGRNNLGALSKTFVAQNDLDV